MAFSSMHVVVLGSSNMRDMERCRVLLYSSGYSSR